MATCLECGGTGFGQRVSPRQASIAGAVFHLLSADGKRDWRGNVKDKLERSSMSTAGPLMAVIRDANAKLKEGYKLHQGEIPEPTLACDHCDGEGYCSHRCCRHYPQPSVPQIGMPRT